MPGDDYLKGYLSIHAKKSIASISLDSPFKLGFSLCYAYTVRSYCRYIQF
jgi:hypothetical protein